MSESASSPSQRPKRRRWLSFSIRGLFLLVLLAAIGMGWIASIRTQHQREKAIAKQIEALDGAVQWNAVSSGGRFSDPFGSDPFAPEPTQYERWRAWLLGDDVDSRISRVVFETHCPAELLVELQKLEALTDLTIVNGSLSDPASEAIRQLTNLTDLSLIDTEISAKQMETIASLPLVDHLYITHGSVSEENLKRLAAFPSLESLSICASEISAEGLAGLRAAKNLLTLKLEADYQKSSSTAELSGLASLTQLEDLRIGEFPVTDHDLEVISTMRSLRILKITPKSSLVKVTSTGITQLFSLGMLNDLDFPAAPFDDEILRSVVKIKALKQLDCDGSRITDAGLKHLEGHPNLRYVTIPGCQVTANAIRSLAKNGSISELGLGDGVGLNFYGLSLVYSGGQTVVRSGGDSNDEEDDVAPLGSSDDPFGADEGGSDPFGPGVGGVF
ncbi:hypothetical protein [Blastopirellula marina]|uniref:Leucine Rich repeats (2 copies) n=1 Tax=Blastopirellula marina TaxID=124 RepID=A0A2S8FWM2_9BACT|nr:hypothetical protein [Blastopirellula marina]PQO36576.1 hypothetical protein C5Y98_11310 [Blastopirellula marina]PTL44406.1 hypothetical protein C5Y97_11320 [Blastopirellula marina]